MIPPAWVVAILSFLASAAMLYEASKKTDFLWRLRWACMFLPFFFQAIAYTWVELFQPSAEVRASVLRWGNFSIVFPIAMYYIMDNWREMSTWIKSKRGRE